MLRDRGRSQPIGHDSIEALAPQCSSCELACYEGPVYRPRVNSEIGKRIEAGRLAVERRGRFVHENLGRVGSELKHDRSRVTEVDIGVAKAVFEELYALFPGDDLFSEEMNPGQGAIERKAPFTWVLDPIDGTNNYIAGMPSCSISLALLHDGNPIYGFLYDLSRRGLIEGGPGQGLFDGGERVRSVPRVLKGSSMVGVHSPRDRSLAALMGKVAERYKVRALGSSALHLGYVAAGLLDGAIDVNVKVWDIAAGYALCLGAGMEVRFLNKNVFPLESFDLEMGPIFYCAGSSEGCDEMEAIVRDVTGIG